MKTISMLAAVAAALASASLASAHDRPAGHGEWHDRPSHGPKSTYPSRTRVRVKDADTRMANCECAMMTADLAPCMMDMPGKAQKPSAG